MIFCLKLHIDNRKRLTKPEKSGSLSYLWKCQELEDVKKFESQVTDKSLKLSRVLQDRCSSQLQLRSGLGMLPVSPSGKVTENRA